MGIEPSNLGEHYHSFFLTLVYSSIPHLLIYISIYSNK
nr:MAG TPA: hypothetical protein [Caudoviricetes sp.]